MKKKSIFIKKGNLQKNMGVVEFKKKGNQDFVIINGIEFKAKIPQSLKKKIK